MKKINLLICIGLLCMGCPLHAQGTVSPMPENKKEKPSRFNLTITGGFNNTRAQYLSEKTEYYSPSGEAQGSETMEDDAIKERNEGQQYHLDLQRVGLRLSYKVWRSLEVWGGIGAASQQGEEKWDATEELTATFKNGSPAAYYEGGLAYGYSFTDKLFARVIPGIMYTHFNDLSMELHHSEGTTVLSDYSMKRSYLEWQIPIIVGYALGKFVPYVGVSYQDYLLTDKYEVTKQYAGQDVELHITDRMNSISKVHGIVGAQFFFARNIAVGFTASFSHNISGVLSFNIGL